MRDYSEPLGYGLGVLGGMATRGAVVAAVGCPLGSRSRRAAPRMQIEGAVEAAAKGPATSRQVSAVNQT